MNGWTATRAGLVLRALMRLGWTVERQRGSHRTLSRPGWPNYVFAFRDSEELGPRMLARIAKRTGLRPDDL
ncbi:MAG TPA: type II toxin-antitoxin system HicA family toxin [Stellaceae bacterium]|nr:type II toxin-antitoxin system HicA family toxin [Stellaceae bacterium]